MRSFIISLLIFQLLVWVLTTGVIAQRATPTPIQGYPPFPCLTPEPTYPGELD